MATSWAWTVVAWIDGLRPGFGDVMGKRVSDSSEAEGASGGMATSWMWTIVAWIDGLRPGFGDVMGKRVSDSSEAEGASGGMATSWMWTIVAWIDGLRPGFGDVMGEGVSDSSEAEGAVFHDLGRGDMSFDIMLSTVNPTLTTVTYACETGPCDPGNPSARKQKVARLGLPGSHGPADTLWRQGVKDSLPGMGYRRHCPRGLEQDRIRLVRLQHMRHRDRKGALSALTRCLPRFATPLGGPCDPGSPPARGKGWGRARIPRIARTRKLSSQKTLNKELRRLTDDRPGRSGFVPAHDSVEPLRPPGG